MRAPLRAGRAVAASLPKSISQSASWQSLASLERYRYLSARQIEELHFFDHATPLTGARTCRRVLERLTESWRALATRAPHRRRARRLGVLSSTRWRRSATGFSMTATAAPHSPPRALARSSSITPWRSPSWPSICIAWRVARATSTSSRSSPNRRCWRRFTAGLEGTQTLKPDLSVSLRAGEYRVPLVRRGRPRHAQRRSRGAQVPPLPALLGDRHRAGPQRPLPESALRGPEHARARSCWSAASPAARHLNGDLFAVTTTAETRWTASREQRHEPPAAQPDPHRRCTPGAGDACRPTRSTASSPARRTSGCATTRMSSRSASRRTSMTTCTSCCSWPASWRACSSRAARFWLNLGDTFSRRPSAGRSREEPRAGPRAPRPGAVGDGWILRNKVIWAKTNPMPTSVRDRLSCTHELVYFFVRERRYFFDLDAIRVPHTSKRSPTAESISLVAALRLARTIDRSATTRASTA